MRPTENDLSGMNSIFRSCFKYLKTFRLMETNSQTGLEIRIVTNENVIPVNLMQCHLMANINRSPPGNG